MKMIVRTDDFGYSLGFNSALKRVLDLGIVTHVELMTDTPGSIDAYQCLRDHPEVSVGWHQHFRGKPVLDASKVPSLVDQNGGFRYREVWDKDTFDMVAINKKFEGVVYEEALMELRAEMEQCLRYMGRVPDFGGGRGDNVVAHATNQVCAEYGILDGKTLAERTGRHIRRLQIPDDNRFEVRKSPDAVTRLTGYDVMGCIRRIPVAEYQDDTVEFTFHCGDLDGYIFVSATFNWEGKPEYFDPSPLIDSWVLSNGEFMQWLMENKVELVTKKDALLGTKCYQNWLRANDKPLFIGRLQA